MEGVDFKKFVQISKANKAMHNAKSVPKYPTLQHAKKVNDQYKNKLSEDKVRHTFVVESQKKDLSKSKKMSLFEGKQAVKLEIKKYIKWSGVYQWTGLTLEERKEKLIEKLNDLHSEEHMIDDEFIYPRGIDYVQKVILFTHRRLQYLDLTVPEIKNEYAQMDLVWTLDWVNKFSNIEELKIYFLNNSKSKSKEIALKDFLILCWKTQKEFYKIRTSSGDLYGFKKGKVRYLQYSECELILKNYWMKSYSRILSVIIGELDISLLQKEYGFIKFEKKLINRTCNINDIDVRDNVVSLKSLDINSHQLSLSKRYIYKNHPLQKELVYDSSTNEYYLSREGYEWFINIYCASNKMDERIQTDLFWHQDYFRKRMMYLQNEYLDLSYNSVKNVWKLTELEYECYMALGKFKLKIDNLNYKDFENLFVELKLRHLAFLKNKKVKDGTGKRKTMYTQVRDLTFFGTYKGTCVNYTINNNVLELYIETKYEEESLKHIKLKIGLNTMDRNERIILLRMMQKNLPIQFIVDIDDEGKGILDSFMIASLFEFKRLKDSNGDFKYKCTL